MLKFFGIVVHAEGGSKVNRAKMSSSIQSNSSPTFMDNASSSGRIRANSGARNPLTRNRANSGTNPANMPVGNWET